MERRPTTWTLEQLSHAFVDIEFPEYQREPDIWSRDQKQRLIDSILRQFDIASVYFYQRDGDLECIDGRQRLNAIMSFLGKNLADERDNGFALQLENEISSGLVTEFEKLDGLTFEQLRAHQANDQSELCTLAAQAIEAILRYEITTVMLSDVHDEEEFNLQFLRLNLGTLINAGEKLHAMVGSVRDVIFDSAEVGQHPFFDHVRIPTRRYAKELTAAQVLLHVFSFAEVEEFARARHVDLQRFVKQHAETEPSNPLIGAVAETLDAMSEGAQGATNYLRNRAVTVSLILLAWRRNVASGSLPAGVFWEFAEEFMARLGWQVEKMKEFDVDPEYSHLVEFQRHVTQASVEKPAVTRRHQILERNLDLWLQEGVLVGDRAFRDRTGADPG